MAHVRTARLGIDPVAVGEYGRKNEAEIDSFSSAGADCPVPHSWSYTTLGEVAEIKGGKRLPMGAKLIDERTDFPYIRVTDFSGFSVDTTSIRYLTPEVQKRIGNYIITKDDVFISIAGTIGRVGTIPEELDGANLTENAARIVLRNKNVEKEFLKYCLAGPEVQSEILSRRSKNAQPKLALVQIKALRIPLPPLDEQKKIAHALSTVQRAIEAQERIIQTTTELKKALMHKLFTEGLHNEPQKQTEIGPVPESWDVVPLSSCAIVQTGVAKGRKIPAEEAIELPYLRVANVQDGFLDLTEMKNITIRKGEQNRYALQNGDVVLTEGGDFDKLGRGFVWHGQIENCVHQNHVFAVRPDSKRLSSEFFAYQAQSPYGKKYFLSVAHKTTNLACINTTKLKAFPVLLPRLEEQVEIMSTFRNIDQRIGIAQLKKSKTAELFSVLLNNLMTARILTS